MAIVCQLHDIALAHKNKSKRMILTVKKSSFWAKGKVCTFINVD